MNAVTSTHRLETVPVDGRFLRCAFSTDGNIFGHVVEVVDGETARKVLATPTIDGDSAWPASPPWQELHVHEQSDGSPALMLVGRAGSSHWSMSVTVDVNGDALFFDVACRLRETPHFVGSTYGVLVRCDGLSVTPATCGDDSVALVSRTDDRVVIDGTHLVDKPGTIRWAYSIAHA